MNNRIKCSLWVFIAAFCMLGASAYAQQEEVAKLDSAINDAMKIMYSAEYADKTYEQKAIAVRTVLQDNYDLTVIIRRTMGRNWNLLSETEQVQVKELVTKMVVNGFIAGLQGLEKPKIKYGELISMGSKRFEIPSMVTFQNSEPLNVTYRFGRLKTGWQIYDILAEDVSVVANYRQQIDDHFQKGTGAELIKKLKKLLEKQNLDETPDLQ